MNSERDERKEQPAAGSQTFQGERLFIGAWSTGISYYDKAQLVDNDYKRIAFLDYHALELEWHSTAPQELIAEIIADAATIQAKRGQPFRIGGRPDQTIILGQ